MSSQVIESSPKLSRVVTSLRNRPLLILVAISVALIAPAIVFGIPSNLDLTNHFRFALPFYDSLHARDFHPGWLAVSNAGYGDASFRFYPPALYYVLSGFRFLTGSWYDAVLVTFGLTFFLAALGMYLWARSLFSPGVALISAVLFSIAPYHLNQFYQATMLAEFVGCAVLPFAFWQLEQISQAQSLRNVAGLGIAFSLLILTHLPLTVIGSIALAVYGLVRVNKKAWKKSLLLMASGALLGLLASASYWVSMIAERFWIRADRIDPLPSVDFRKNFVFSTFSADFLNVWWMNILVLFTFALFGPTLILLHGKTRQSLGKPVLTFSLMLLCTLAMSTMLTWPIWVFLKPLQQTQFPWRWLGIVSMFGSIMTAASIPAWRQVAMGRLRPLCLVVMSGILISVAFSCAHIVREAQFLSASDFNRTLTSIPGSNSVGQWLPVWASERPIRMEEQVNVGQRVVSVDEWGPEKRVFRVSQGSESQARIKTFFYPHWRAFADRNELLVKAAEDGAILVSLPKEATTVTLQFVEPARTRVAECITLFAWFLIVITLLAGRSCRNTPVSMRT